MVRGPSGAIESARRLRRADRSLRSTRGSRAANGLATSTLYISCKLATNAINYRVNQRSRDAHVIGKQSPIRTVWEDSAK